jgi:Tol biopolymer transport system component
MTADRALDQQLGAWFDERSTTTAPDGLLERSLARANATPQRPGWLVTDRWRSLRATSRPGRRWLLVVATLAIGTGVVGASLIGGRLIAPNPSPTNLNAVTDPTALPSPAPSETSAVVQPRVPGWSTTGSTIGPRWRQSATLLRDGRVLVAGGFGGSGEVSSSLLASAELYDPATGSWTATGSMSAPRYGHTATMLPDGKVLVAGGADTRVLGIASAELYDPGTGTWSATGTMGTPRRYGHTATLLPDGKVLVAGGHDAADDPVASAELYDTATGSWTATGSMGTSRYDHAAALLLDGMVLVTGGADHVGGACCYLASSEIYDPDTGSWTATGSMGVPHGMHEATLLADGRVLVGGAAELYDPSTGSWTATGGTGVSWSYGSATLLADGRVLVLGAWLGPEDFPTDTAAYLYDPGTGSWAAAGKLGTPRDFETATLLADGRVLVAGGSNLNSGVLLASAELYEPGNEIAAASPAPSTSGMFAYILPSSSEGVLAYVGALWVANADGTGARRLAQGLGGSLGAPAWSPDGTRVVFSRTPFDGSYYPIGISQLYVTDASGSEPQLVDTGCVAPCLGDSDAAFSMDGKRLVFVRTITGGSVLATVDLTTGHVVELASTTVTDASGDFQSYTPANYHPRWSPDGMQIAFTQDVPNDVSGRVSEWGPLPAVFVVDADGRNLTQIGPAALTVDWSPDGARIVFGSVAMPGLLRYLDIHTIRPDGTDLRRLTSDEVSTNPSWTVDGRIEFIRGPLEQTPEGLTSRIGPREFWMMDADGDNATELSPPPLPERAWPISWPPRM